MFRTQPEAPRPSNQSHSQVGTPRPSNTTSLGTDPCALTLFLHWVCTCAHAMIWAPNLAGDDLRTGIRASPNMIRALGPEPWALAQFPHSDPNPAALHDSCTLPPLCTPLLFPNSDPNLALYDSRTRIRTLGLGTIPTLGPEPCLIQCAH